MRNNNSILKASKNLSIRQNVCLQVIDETTGQVVQQHIGHNSATNSLLFGIAHHLVGDFSLNEPHKAGSTLNPAYSLLSNYVPRYISLGTMGLIDQTQDSQGLPAGIGDTIPDYDDPEYQALQEAYQAALDAYEAAKKALADDCPIFGQIDACKDCQECNDRITQKRQAVETTKTALDKAYEALMTYGEEARFVEYMEHRPGYGADGYDGSENNSRKYFGLGYAYTTFDNTEHYEVGDTVMYNGLLYRCILDTPDPAGALDTAHWELVEDAYQPSKDTTVRLELVSPSFPREPISYRDVIPEYESEAPQTIDVVFSAMISTGALKQFRPKDAEGNSQDYIFITEAGLWSKREWQDSSENGLLAGYRIVPPNQKNWDMTKQENRDILKRQILKVGRNQVVQVVWKIQLIADDSYVIDEPEPIEKISLDTSGEVWGDIDGISWQETDNTHTW